MLLADGLSQSGPIVIGGMSKVFVCYSLNVRQMRSLPRDRRWTCSENETRPLLTGLPHSKDPNTPVTGDRYFSF
jgi:hypothetical protein